MWADSLRRGMTEMMIIAAMNIEQAASVAMAQQGPRR